MRPSEIKAQLQEAIALAQAQQRTDARRLFTEIVQADPRQEIAWMWLATLSPDRDERIAYLERALVLNPDNPTTRQAYEQLTGQPYQPPAHDQMADDAGPSAPARPWWQTLTRDMSLSTGKIVILMALAAGAVVIILIAVNARGEDNNSGGSSGATIEFILPTNTPSPIYTPTITLTPFPSPTEGPSPTSIWSVGIPTWTPIPSRTIPPSSTPLPTLTPIPTRTDTYTPTHTYTPLPPTETRTPAPTRTRSASATLTLAPTDTAVPSPIPASDTPEKAN